MGCTASFIYFICTCQIQGRDHRGMTSPSKKKCGLVGKEEMEIDFCHAIRAVF